MHVAWHGYVLLTQSCQTACICACSGPMNMLSVTIGDSVHGFNWQDIVARHDGQTALLLATKVMM